MILACVASFIAGVLVAMAIMTLLLEDSDEDYNV